MRRSARAAGESMGNEVIGRLCENKSSTRLDFGLEFSKAACGRNRRGADGAPPSRRQAADIGRGGRRPPLPVRKTGSLNLEDREAFAAEQGALAPDQGVIPEFSVPTLTLVVLWRLFRGCRLLGRSK